MKVGDLVRIKKSTLRGHCTVWARYAADNKTPLLITKIKEVPCGWSLCTLLAPAIPGIELVKNRTVFMHTWKLTKRGVK